MCHETCGHPVSGGDHLDEQTISLETSNGEQLPVLVVLPEQLPAPAVMIIHDIYGPGEFYQDLVRRLALAGYIAALPDFFFRQGPIAERSEARTRGARVVEAKTMDDIATTLTWLQNHDDATGRLGTIGMCWGGSLVMLAASADPAPDVSIPFYGFPVRERTPNFPILPIDDDQIAGLESPMYGFWGDQDTGVGMDNLAEYDAKLTEYHKPHEFTIYPGLGHAFLTFNPDDDAFEASQQAWARTLELLGSYLRVADGE